MPEAKRKVLLTDRLVRGLKPGPSRRQFITWDTSLRNFGVRVSGTGRKAFVVVRRLPDSDKPIWRTVGHYPMMTLAEAREKAREALRSISIGDAPKPAIRNQRPAPSDEDAFATVARGFCRVILSQLKSGAITESMIIGTLVPAWGDRPITSFRRGDVVDLAEAVAADRGRSAGKHVIAASRRLFDWALIKGQVGANPAAGIRVKTLFGRFDERERVLSDEELRRLWVAAGEEGYPWSPIFRLWMLTGLRRREVSEMRWSEIHGRTLVIPASRMKGGVTHSVPLTGEAVRILDELPRFVRGDHVFSTTGGVSPVKNPDRAKARIERRVGAAEPWVIHDVRRTVRTNLGALGVPPVIAGLVLAHAQVGMSKVYDRHTYDREKRDALEQWERRLISILAAPPTADRAPRPADVP